MNKTILAIECSQAKASLCLAVAGNVVYQAQWQAERNHDAHLFPALKESLTHLNGDKLACILVGSGPGSYGGIRVALAAAQGLALVHHAHVIALCSWESLAAQGTRAIISDAKRGGWTFRHPNGSIDVLETEALKAKIAAGEKVASVETEEQLAKHSIQVQESGLVPQATGLVESWLARSPEAQEAALKSIPEPIYVRPPHITKAKHKPWEC